MKKFYLNLIILLSFTFTLHAQNQRGCGTMDYLQEQLAADPAIESRMQQIERDIDQWSSSAPESRVQAVITIPVVFHVVYNVNSSAQNISDARLMAQLDVLNKDFGRTNADAANTPSVFQGVAANTTIQFCLAQRDPSGAPSTGIVRVPTSVTSFSSNNNVKYTSSGGSNAWPASSYMNIWVCNLGGGLLGYAQFPGGAAATDGVVVLYSSVGSPSVPGTATPYHLGRTATHEVGHWLNLRHIWGDSNCGSDQVSDTPTQQTANYGCPSFPHVTCSNGPSGDMFMNYMDYTDDVCMNMFTSGQSTRMIASINSSRSGLLTSVGCNPPGGCGTPGSLSASSITMNTATLNWGAVPGASSYNVQYKPSSSSTWISTTSSTNSKSISGLTAATAYDFQVQAICGSTSGTYSGNGTFTTSSSGMCTDVYESNNTSSTAKVITVNTDINALISTTSDIDWYKFTTTTPNTNFQLTLNNLPADYDVKLYRSNLQLLNTSQNGGTTPEMINRNSSTGATYYVRVYGYNGANSTTQCYRLRITTSSSAFRLEDNMSDASKDELINGIVALPNPASSQATFEFLSEIPGPANVMLVDMRGRVVSSNSYFVEEGINRMPVNLENYSNGLYFILIDQQGDRRRGRFIIQH